MVNWHDWFIYDETSKSCLRWKVATYCGREYKTPNTLPGDAVGTLRTGYYDARLNSDNYGCHRIIWEMFNGEIAHGLHIDHIDKNRTNNCISNLRLVTQKLNSQNRTVSSNNTSGHVGVRRKISRSGTPAWQADWQENGKTHSKYFSIRKLGEDVAKQSAIDFRNKMLDKLNESGSDYSSTHYA